MKIPMNNLLSFQELYNRIKDNKMSIKTAYKFNKLFSTIEEELMFYREEMQKLLEKYGDKDEHGNYVYLNDGNSIKIKADSLIECQQRIFELNSLEVELPDILFDLEELEMIELTISEFGCLESFLNIDSIQID